MPKKSAPRKCPYCKSEKYKTLREGKYCRACDKRLWKTLDRWVTNEFHDNMKRLVGVLESHRMYDCTGADYRFEIVNAARLLDKCGEDFHLAVDVFSIKANRSKKHIESLSWVIGRGFDRDLKTARQQRAKQEREDKRRQAVASTIKKRSDLFDDEMEPTS